MLKKIIPVLTLSILLCCAAVAGAADAKNPQVLMETSLGKIRIELFAKEAPVSVKNFLDYRVHTEIDRRADQERSRQRPEEQPGDHCHGPHRCSGQRHLAIFHQRGQ